MKIKFVMINLLPPIEKEKILKERQWKLILILGVIIFSFLVFLCLILFFVENLIAGNINSQKFFLKQYEEKNISIKKIESEINKANVVFSDINSFYEKDFSAESVFKKTLNLLPKGSYLTNFSFNRSTVEEKREGSAKLIKRYIKKISISGYSPSIDDLLKFKSNLGKEESFSRIYFPVDIWTESVDIKFTISFEVI